MPLCYGGGIKTAKQAQKIIAFGVEKVAVASGAIDNPALISEIAQEIGSQSVVAVVDSKKGRGAGYTVWTHNGRINSGKSPVEVGQEAEARGAGEILVNSIDQDGMMRGYDLDLARAMREAVTVPLTVLGGAGSLADLGRLVALCGVVGAAAGSLFVFKGSYKAVLINYPGPDQKEALIRSALCA